MDNKKKLLLPDYDEINKAYESGLMDQEDTGGTGSSEGGDHGGPE